MDEKERKDLIEAIKTRVEVWNNKTYEFDTIYPEVGLVNGNRFTVSKLYIERHDTYEDVMVTLGDEIIGDVECYAQHLNDLSLSRLLAILPEVKTIFITAHDGDDDAFCVLTKPVHANFTAEDLENFLKKNFPLLDWEWDDVESFVCYTERTDHAGPYLLASLNSHD